PLPARLPARIRLDRFALLRAGARGATLHAPHAPCDIVVEAPEGGTLIVQLAAAPVEASDLTDPVERALLALLVALGCVSAAEADEAPARKCWEFHDASFHCASQLHDDGVARGATYRFGDWPPPPALRPPYGGTEIALPEPSASRASGRTLRQV